MTALFFVRDAEPRQELQHVPTFSSSQSLATRPPCQLGTHSPSGYARTQQGCTVSKRKRLTRAFGKDSSKSLRIDASKMVDDPMLNVIGRKKR
jgi:hypothetical protein